jgi:ubiquinone/menaquinone biosynthesis C-methylase UbiE
MRQENLSRLSSINVKKGSQDFLVMHYLIRDLKAVIREHAHGNVLDVGCGNKPYEEIFTGKVESYTGCDVVQSDKHKVDVICPATELKFADNSFETVFSTQVIEHVNDPFKMLAEINRVLKDNGCLILSAPFSWELHEEPYDFYRYTKYGLQAMLEQNGFQVLSVLPNGGKWAAIVQLNLNIIYSTFKKRALAAKMLKALFTKLGFTTLMNSIALSLDKKHFDDLLTLNYVVLARKK